MTDYIRLPRSALTDDLWRNKDYGCLLWFLLSKADSNGVATFTAADIEARLGISRQRLRTMLSKMQKSALATNPQPVSNQKATNITFDFQSIGSVEQPTSNQKATKSQPVKATKKAIPQDGFERFRQWFNDTIGDTEIPRLTKLTDPRKAALRSIFKEYDKETVETAVKKVAASDFLSKGWGKAGFDWIFKKSNFIKILEGYYDNRTTNPTATDKYAARRGTDVGNHTEADYGGPF